MLQGGSTMPLLDHFHPPLRAQRPWEGFHSYWAGAITHQLNKGLLPARFYAVPHTKMGSQVEVDAATFENEETAGVLESGNGGVATAVYAPPQPPLVQSIDFDNVDVFEVMVFQDDSSGRLVAAIELV